MSTDTLNIETKSPRILKQERHAIKRAHLKGLIVVNPETLAEEDLPAENAPVIEENTNIPQYPVVVEEDEEDLPVPEVMQVRFIPVTTEKPRNCRAQLGAVNPYRQASATLAYQPSGVMFNYRIPGDGSEKL